MTRFTADFIFHDLY